MASNFFGNLFRITTFGESHGKGIGVVIDGCPSGVSISEQEIHEALQKRRPGKNPLTSPRKEEDLVELLSGVFEGKTTGAPIALLIRNEDAQSAPYAPLKDLYRPGHANFTYLEKYGVFDDRGGGRASARETAARVAAGAVAKKFLSSFGIDCVAFISAIGDIVMPALPPKNLADLRIQTAESPVYCPHPETAQRMRDQLRLIQEEKDSIGGIVSCIAHIPRGLGDPIYEKLDARLAFALLSIPATKGFEVGSGFHAAQMKGSAHNDPFDLDEEGNVCTATNWSGGLLGGISTGAPLYFRVAFKPTSSIQKEQRTINRSGERTLFQIPETGRHDPCVAIRAVPVVEAMTNLVLADAVLMNRNVKKEVAGHLFY